MKPYVTIKFAQTLDGKIAAKDGSSKWISSPESRKFAHKLRAQNDAVLVGIGTVLKDNPSLTVRLAKGKNPLRIIIDSRLRVPYSSKIVKEAKRTKTIIFTSKKAPRYKIKKLEAENIEVIVPAGRRKHDIDIGAVITILYKKGVRKILVEGGQGIITSFLKRRFADEIVAIISPKILGKGVDTVGDLRIKNIKGALKLRLKDVERLNEDIIYRALVKK